MSFFHYTPNLFLKIQIFENNILFPQIVKFSLFETLAVSTTFKSQSYKPGCFHILDIYLTRATRFPVV